MLNNFKYRTIFSSIIKSVSSEEKDKYLAKASLDEIRKYIPNVNFDSQYNDLLPIAAEAFNVNKFNKNGDGIGSELGVKIYKSFINKPLNLNHFRPTVIGFNLSSNLITYDTNEPLTDEQAQKLTKPFNVIIGSLIWRIVNPKLANLIEESSDKESELYNKIFESFEVGFNNYNIWKIKGRSRNFEDGEIVKDEKEIEKLDKILTSNGGSGKLDNDTYIFRELCGNAIGLAMAIVESPAGFLKAIVTEPLDNKIVANIEKKENPISQSSNSPVNKTKEQTISTNKKENIMIKSIKELTDENLKEIKANVVMELFEKGIKDASEEYVKERDAKTKSITELETKNKEVFAEAEKTKKDLETLTEKFNSLNSQILAKQNEDKFNTRMGYFDNEYELIDADREILAGDIKEIKTDEDFDKYSKKMSVLMAAKNKNFIKMLKEKQKEKEGGKSDKKEDDKETKEAKASEENAQSILDKALETSAQDKTKLPNVSAPEQTLLEKFKDAFSFENCVAPTKGYKP